jgi:hypothetical protein
MMVNAYVSVTHPRITRIGHRFDLFAHHRQEAVGMIEFTSYPAEKVRVVSGRSLFSSGKREARKNLFTPSVDYDR